MATGQRREARIPAARPVELESGIGITQNVSASGVFFETDLDHAEGSKINFAIELDGPQGKKLMLRCYGEIVRVERRDGKVGVAAKIVASKLESEF
jgi:hypothetical protein